MYWNLAIALKIVNLRWRNSLGRSIRLKWATSWLFHAFRWFLTLITGVRIVPQTRSLNRNRLLLQARQTIGFFWICWNSRILPATACKMTAHYNLWVMFGWLLLSYMLLLLTGRDDRLLRQLYALTRASISRARPRWQPNRQRFSFSIPDVLLPKHLLLLK